MYIYADLSSHENTAIMKRVAELAAAPDSPLGLWGLRCDNDDLENVSAIKIFVLARRGDPGLSDLLAACTTIGQSALCDYMKLDTESYVFPTTTTKEQRHD